MGVQVTKDNVQAMIRAISTLAQKDVLVGIPDSAPERDDPRDAMSNAVLGYIHENGTATIPARPFLVPGIHDAQEKIAAALGKGAKAAMDGSPTNAENALNAAGLIGQNAARAKINTGPFQELSAGTLASRRRRGRTGTKPLIVTGQLRNSITYVIRSK